MSDESKAAVTGLIRALSFDPGERNLGGALVVHDGRAGEPHSDWRYHVRWWALWDLKVVGDGSRSENLDALIALVQTDPVVRRLLLDPTVRVYIEHQEGFDFRRPELGAALMPMCTVAGALYTLFKVHGHPVELVGKKSKWGWTSYIHTAGYGRLSEAGKRERRKYCITLYVRNLIERQQAASDGLGSAAGLAIAVFGTPAFFACAAGKLLLDRFDALAFEDQAHMCDAIVQAMHALRKLFRVSAPNTIRDETVWAPLAAQAIAAVPAPPPPSTTVTSTTTKTSPITPTRRRKTPGARAKKAWRPGKAWW